MNPLSNSQPAGFAASANTPVVVAGGTASRHETKQRSGTPDKLIKTLHLINGEHYSGAERVQDLLAACLPENGFEVGFACVKPLHFEERRKCKQAAIHHTRMRNRFDLSVARKVARLALENDYQILHAHTPRTVMIARLATQLCRLPYVYHVHSPTARDSTRGLTNRMNQWIENWSIRKAARLITVSRSLGDHMQSLGVDQSRISVVPNGVPVVADKLGRECLLPDYSAQQSQTACPTIGTVALIRPRKGVEVLLQAMAELKRKNLLVRLRAVGPFETETYETEILQMADKLGVQDMVDWVGFTSDVSAELNQMDLFVLPSLFGEGLPMVVLESMAVGVPVISTDVEGIPEALRDGVDGLIARANDPQDLAAKIADALSDRDRLLKMGVDARTRQRNCFSDHSMAAGVAAAYRLVLKDQA